MINHGNPIKILVLSANLPEPAGGAAAGTIQNSIVGGLEKRGISGGDLGRLGFWHDTLTLHFHG